ncbi:putative signaling protein [Rhodocyclaceae bacterium]|nr:putative signaling protein [Rhodocyclaceae bacterium]
MKSARARGFAIELVRQLVVPTFVLDAESRVVVWNKACERLTGMPASEVIGTREHWRAFYGEPRPCLADLVVQGRMEEVGRLYAAHGDSADDPFGAHAENWCVMPLRGTELYLAIDAGPIRDEEGRIIAVVETLRDMTYRKRTEAALQLTASVFENSQEGIMITDASTCIVNVNGAFTAVTGYSLDEVAGRTPAFLKSGLQDEIFYRDLWARLKECGQWHGEIWNRKKSGEFYPEILSINAVRNSDGEVVNYVGMFNDITDLKKTQQRLESLANYDALTGLPNRVLLADRLHQALANAKRYQRMFAVCFLDLDGFKPINDRHGHETGDRFLVEVAKRLTQTVRGGDTVARLGGDEFVLLITDLKEYQELETALERVLGCVARPFRVDGVELGVSASIGVTLFPLDDSDPDTLLRHADQAMYQAKQLGRNRYHLFDMEADSNLQNRNLQLDRLRQALQHGEFRLYYQPKVNMRSGEVVGMEALIRWQHPERGIVGPLDFLPLAEETPLIVDIGEWVLHEALSQMTEWALEGLPMSVSVNIAARHFQHIDFVPRLRTILSEHAEVSPQLLELEILESAALEDVDMVRTVMGACQAIGVKFALDDFGTGYSSLSYLKRLPANVLKIDQSFVRDMLDDQEDLAIIEGVIGLSTVFRMGVIAEGVETAEHGLLLMRFGCDLAQGYGIARPMPADQVAGWVSGYRPDPKWALWGAKAWDRMDLPLLLAQYDHIKWVQRIVDALHRPETDFLAEDIADHLECRFGNWYDGEGRRNYGGLPEYGEIAAIHAQLHELGAEVVRRHNAGERQSAEALCAELRAVKDLMVARLASLQKSVALWTD